MAEERDINPKIIQWFQGRKISEKTIRDTGIYSGRRHQSGVEYDPLGNIIVFPYFSKGKKVNEKHRTGDKRFSQIPGGQKVFWNDDVIDDPLLQTDDASLVITEGEIDALSFIEAGYPWVVSVPDGAPPPREGATEEEIDPALDGKFSYIARIWDRLKLVKRIIIAVDTDDPGKRLAEELVRRLGRVRCLFVNYPEECKDANDVLVKHGKDALIEVLVEAKPYPVSGVYTFSQLPAEPDFIPVSTGWGMLDDKIKLFYPAFMAVTGKAGSGKSTWVNQLVAQIAVLHGWSTAIASFEMRIKPFVTDTFRAVHKELNVKEDVEVWMEKNFVFIAPEPGDDSDYFDIAWLIERAEAAVIRHGIRVLVIDPWNEVEHSFRRGESLTDYTGRAIRALKRFGREFDVLVIVVAHPTKEGAKKQSDEITLYDISDSAHFANKADLGVVIARIDNSMQTFIMVQKVRYQPLTGMRGKHGVTYSYESKTFSQ